MGLPDPGGCGGYAPGRAAGDADGVRAGRWRRGGVDRPGCSRPHLASLQMEIKAIHATEAVALCSFGLCQTRVPGTQKLQTRHEDAKNTGNRGPYR